MKGQTSVKKILPEKFSNLIAFQNQAYERGKGERYCTRGNTFLV